MDAEASTRDSQKNELSTTTSEAEKAYIYKQQGKRIGWIVDNTIYNDATEVHLAIKNYMITQRMEEESDERDHGLQMEIERLDAVQAEMWEIMQHASRDSDAISAAKLVLQAVKQRSELKGYAKIDPVAGAAQVLVIQGDTKNYVDRLKATLPGHVLENGREEA